MRVPRSDITLPTLRSESPDAAPPGPRTWRRRIIGGGVHTETCTPWCTDRHLGDEVGALDELQHGVSLPGVEVQVDDARGGTVPLQLLAPRIAVEPYSEDPARRVPHLLLEVAPDEYTGPLSPAEFEATLDAVEAHVQCMRQVVLLQLQAARA